MSPVYVPTGMRSLPTAFVVILAIAVGTAWLLVLAFLAAVVFAYGPGNPINGLLPGGLDGAMEIAIYIQYGLTTLTILTVLGFGTAVLVFVTNSAHDAASFSAILMVRIMIATTVLGWLAQIAMPLAASGSILVTLSSLMIGLPTTSGLIACLVLADHYLRRPEPDIF